MAGESDKNQVVGAGEAGVLVSALEHPMVLAALSRMASSGAWQRVVDGQPLTEEADVVDAQFLVAGSAVTRVADDTFELAASDPMHGIWHTLAHRTQYQLRRALAHATGHRTGWASEDPETVLSFGRATGAGADIIADLLLPQLPMSAAAFADYFLSSPCHRSRRRRDLDPARQPIPGHACRWTRRVAARSRCRTSRSRPERTLGEHRPARLQSISAVSTITRTTTSHGSLSRRYLDPRS